MKVSLKVNAVWLLGLFLLCSSEWAVADGSRVTATGGATSIEGSAGGGVVPWAVINGYGSSDEWSATAVATGVFVDDYTLKVIGASVSYDNRIELSYARQRLKLDTIGGYLEQDIYGVKYKVAGELLYTRMPQISVGVQYKTVDDFFLPEAVGARDDSGIDYYVAASKVFFDAFMGRNVLVNGTLRATKANQGGLLGFGSADNNDYELMNEVAVALLLTDSLVVGMDYREKPDELDFAGEDDWQDFFIGWFANKNFSVVLAYADLGSIAGLDNQKGWYLSFEAAL